MPRATAAAIDSAPIGPAPVTSIRWPMCAAPRVSPWSATASGSVSAAARSDNPSGRASKLVSGTRDELCEGSLPGAVALTERTTAGAQRGPAGAAVLALAAFCAGAADHLVADLPALHSLAHGGYPAGELVTLDGARATPAVEHEMQVAAADTAVADLEQHVTGADLGDGPLLDDQITLPAVHGGLHRRRKLGHPPSQHGPDTSVNLARWAIRSIRRPRQRVREAIAWQPIS